MNRTLFGKELKSNLPVVGIITAVLILYLVVVVSMFDPELGASLDIMMESMPEVFAAFGMANQSATLIDFLINYLYGFLLTLMPFVLVVIMVNKLMVRYIDRGTMAYLLATPVSRTRIALSMAGVLITMLVLHMVVVTLVEIASSEAMFAGELDRVALLQVNAGLFGLWIFLAGLCFCSACLFSKAGPALWVGSGLSIVLFLMQMIAQTSKELEVLNTVNPLMLFDPYGLAAGEMQAIGGAVMLCALGMALFAVGTVVFSRRDLSL